jgi:TonB family protein
MTRAVPFVLAGLAACGGKAPPPAPPPAPPAHAHHATRVPVDDDEPEEGVTIINARGRMDQQAVVAGLTPHNEELSQCYMSRVGRRRWLGGHVVLHWDIKADGTITSVKLAESNLGAWPVEKCLVDVARAATFAKPIGGDADFTVPLDFSARGGSLAWTEDQALRAIGGQLAKLDSCTKDEKAPDDVVVTLYVGPHGKAKSVGFSSVKSEITEDWAACAQKVALAWRLPDPRGHIAKLAITYRPD